MIGTILVVLLVWVTDDIRTVESFRYTSLRRSSPQTFRPQTATKSTPSVNRSPRLFHSVLQVQSRNKNDETVIDYQSDEDYGRGDMHLSAAVNEGDTIVYRTGSWYVDGVLVGDNTDAPPAYELCRLETIQVCWTHNCEHGVLRGLVVDVDSDKNNSTKGSLQQSQRLFLRKPMEEVEFGPEQIIARIRNIQWEVTESDDNSADEIGTSSISLHYSVWKEHDANNDDMDGID